MKDFLGNELNDGDEVVFTQKNYRNLMRGRIVRRTAQTVLIEHQHPYDKNAKSQTRQSPDQVVKIPMRGDDNADASPARASVPAR